MQALNLYQNIPQQLPDELVDTLLAAGSVKIERIVSRGQHSPPGFWYDQEQPEWVLLVKGEASIRFADQALPVTLKAGDYLHIAAHVRHRVESTSATEDCIWLAVFY